MSENNGPLTLAIDIGGTGLKADVIDAQGQPVAERQRVNGSEENSRRQNRGECRPIMGRGKRP